ncbi:hypothetical protein ACJX0J_032667, partial [Zea mays]
GNNINYEPIPIHRLDDPYLESHLEGIPVFSFAVHISLWLIPRVYLVDKFGLDALNENVEVNPGIIMLVIDASSLIFTGSENLLGTIKRVRLQVREMVEKQVRSISFSEKCFVETKLHIEMPRDSTAAFCFSFLFPTTALTHIDASNNAVEVISSISIMFMFTGAFNRDDLVIHITITIYPIQID